MKFPSCVWIPCRTTSRPNTRAAGSLAIAAMVGSLRSRTLRAEPAVSNSTCGRIQGTVRRKSWH